jgi:hypothetical protein
MVGRSRDRCDTVCIAVNIYGRRPRAESHGVGTDAGGVAPRAGGDGGYGENGAKFYKIFHLIFSCVYFGFGVVVEDNQFFCLYLRGYLICW